jgi:hypothetical protein
LQVGNIQPAACTLHYLLLLLLLLLPAAATAAAALADDMHLPSLPCH